MTRVLAAGIDVGASAVKIAFVRTSADAAPEVLGLTTERIRRRDLRAVVEDAWTAALAGVGLSAGDVDYAASTGDGELVNFRRGHFYSMTTHARGATFLVPGARAVLDAGALHARAMTIDARSRVLASRMTSQCASGSGQFLENVARYLGVTLDEVGRLSRTSSSPEQVSSICAVLAETDVINMVSRGIATADILKGIHLSMAGRFIKLLQAIRADGDVVVTGGLAADDGLIECLREQAAAERLPVAIRMHADSLYAGALGAALWGAHRHTVLARRAGAVA